MAAGGADGAGGAEGAVLAGGAGVAVGAHEGPGRRRRLAVALGAGLLTVLIIALPLGLVGGRVLGTEDNGDGYRLFCGVGLAARTVDRLASWKGGVVTDFAVGPPSCGLWIPSSAGLLLRAAALGHRTLTLVTVAWWYTALVALVVAVAAWAASASRCRRAAVLIVPVAPLALTAFSRFFVSTYAEPLGLVGTVAAACGIAALAVAGPGRHGARRLALALAVVGAVVAATAKAAYLPVLAVVVVVAVVALVTRVVVVRRWVLAAAVAVTVTAVALPVAGAMHFQEQVYEGANVHDVAFTMALYELGPGGPAELGLPPEASAVVGNGFFNGPPLPTATWWRDAIGDRPGPLRRQALLALAEHPTALGRALGVGLQATTRADLPYLASQPADPARFSRAAGDPGWSGAHQPDLHGVLDATRRPAWVPTVLVLAALVAGVGAVVSVARRRRVTAAARWGLAAGLGAVGALGLVVVALVGDGYFEVFKHVWLAAYLLLVTGLCLLAGLVRLARAAVPTRRSPAAPAPGAEALTTPSGVPAATVGSRGGASTEVQ